MLWQNPQAAWALAALGYICLLYMLRRRYIDTPVNSTLLWRRTLADRSASKPMEKLKKNLSMALNLLAALCLALALMRPALPGGAAGEVMLVFDLSASMQADSRGKSRLARAVDHASALISSLPQGSRVSVVSAGGQTRQLLSRAENRQMALKALDSIRAGNGGSDLTQALSLSRAMAREAGGLETLVYTDEALEAGQGIKRVAPFEGADNTAVLLLSKQGAQALCRVANYGQARALTLECYADGALADARTLTLGAGESGEARFEVPVNARHLRAQIAQSDALPLDNSYDLIVEEARGRTVALAGAGNVFLENALTLDGGVLLTRGSAREVAATGGYELYIFDGEQPDALPEMGHIVRLIWGGEGKHGTLKRAPGALASRLTRNMPLNNTAAENYTRLDGGTPLLVAGDAPVLTYENKGRQIVITFGFDIRDSNLPLKMDFPVLIQNLLSQLLAKPVSVQAGAACAEDIVLTLDARALSARVTTPSGAIYPVAASGAFDVTDEDGVYRFEQTLEGETREDLFALNMPRSESDVRVVETGDEVSVAAAGGVSGGRELTRLLALLALALVLTEWWVSQRGL